MGESSTVSTADPAVPVTDPQAAPPGRAVPEPVPGLTGITAIASGGYSAYALTHQH